MFDMKNMKRLKTLDENAPDAMKAFWAFDEAAFAEGALTEHEFEIEFLDPGVEAFSFTFG